MLIELQNEIPMCKIMIKEVVLARTTKYLFQNVWNTIKYFGYWNKGAKRKEKVFNLRNIIVIAKTVGLTYLLIWRQDVIFFFQKCAPKCLKWAPLKPRHPRVETALCRPHFPGRLCACRFNYAQGRASITRTYSVPVLECAWSDGFRLHLSTHNINSLLT